MAKFIQLFERDGKTVCWDSKRKQLVAVQVETIVIKQEAVEVIKALVDAAEQFTDKEENDA